MFQRTEAEAGGRTLTKLGPRVIALMLGVAPLGAPLGAQRGSNAQGPPVEVTVNGRTWTQQQLCQRNIGAPDDQTTPFPPHKVIGNI